MEGQDIPRAFPNTTLGADRLLCARLRKCWEKNKINNINKA